MTKTHKASLKTLAGIAEYQLANGLKVLLFKDLSQASLTVNITYLVGSRHEGRGEAGMAHLLEHMLFRGTKDISDIKGALQDKGAQFNATTWFDRTNYFETLVSSDDNLEFALRLEADRMLNSTILQSDLDSEMTVVRNEFEMGENNPVHVLHDQMMSAAYRWHNYGKTTIGNRSDIERVPATSLRAFYEHYYQPDNAVLIIAGRFDEQKALDLVDKYFATLKKPQRKLENTYTEEPAQDGPREVVLERVGDVASAALGYHIPAASHEDHAAIKIFMDCICDEPAGLLYKKFVESGKCSETFSMTYSLCEPGMALCFARPTKNDDAHKIRDELVLLVEDQAQTFIDERQVDRIKTRALKQISLAMKDSKNMALKLSEAIACGDWRLFFWHKEQVAKVSLEQVKRIAKKYFVKSNRTSGVFSPSKGQERVHIERVQSLDTILAGLKDDDHVGEGEEFIATTKNIENLVRRLSAAEGQKIAFLPKKSRGQAVKVKAVFRFGNEALLKPYSEEMEILPSMLWRGTKNFDYQALRDKFDSLMSNLSLDGSTGVVSASINSERKFVAEAIALLGEMLKQPAFKASEFAIIKQREIDDIEEIKNDPQRLGFLELDRLKNPWPKDSILYVQNFDERLKSLQALKLENIVDVFNKVFNPNNLSLSLVGDVDGDEIIRQIPQYFAQNLAKPKFERIKTPFIKNNVQDLVFDTLDKEMAIVAMAFNFAMRDDHEDYAALKLANYMFGENMNSRLMHRIREKEGISYGAGSFIEVSRFDDFASLNIYAMSAPQSVSRAKKAINEEFSRFISDGVLEAELKAAKESIWLSFENMLANDGYLASALAADLDIKRDFFWRESIFTKMNKLSSSEIKAVAQKWFGNAKFSIVCAGDKSKLA